MHILSLLYILTLIDPHFSLTCPPNFQMTYENICIVIERKITRFCSAAEHCAKVGEREKMLVFLIGRNVLRIPRPFGDSRGMLTGINFLLEPPIGGNPVWRDLNPNSPEYTATDKELRYQTRTMRSNNRYSLLWFPNERVLRDSSIFISPYVSETVCEYGGVLPDGHRKVQFRSNFPKPLSVLVHSDAKISGCEANVIARTKLDCARRCALNPACRSIYFESGNNSCILMMHADSLLSLSTGSRGSGWVRFAKMSLGLKMGAGT
ncbi:hypothetical protein CRM22_006071 [Opisthorchis felineus]|uniref:Apple domain-containing protein n=1 Tax=Opisthorchis felineus TaxID=147828 RepID=A0A4S2LVC8_OPIFE|nr:hypothetical protein CRM22_006071 [Opisthorchis felineus]